MVQVFDESNIDRYDHDKYGEVLDAILADQHISRSDLLTVSKVDVGNLLVVYRSGISLGSQYGVFKKKLQIGPHYSMALLSRLTTEMPALREFAIEGFDASDKRIFQVRWGTGGSVSVEDAVEERKRVFAVIGAAMDAAAGPTRPSIATFDSHWAGLLTWAEDVVTASGAHVTAERVSEHAAMASGMINFKVFLPLGAPHGIDDLNAFFPSGRMPEGDAPATFDAVHAEVARTVGGPGVVDARIDSLLADIWGSFVNGCREQYA